ncbi:hypothetical protein ACROSR_07850 [Roseovarius tibetensis]|uniref:hypothetical protein n=1 Tax=Roseovarius tibetensis TaxID=2685897 RepID=UPI003D7FF2FB
MPQQLPLPGFQLPERPSEARNARAALARYPDLEGPTLCRYAKLLGKSGELLFDSLMMRLGERVVPADEHEHFDRVLWLQDIFLRVQIKTRNVPSGAGFHFEIRKGYQRGPAGTKPYARTDFDLLALVVLPESVIKFTAEWRASHVVAASEIPGLRQRPRQSFDTALGDLGLSEAIPDPVPDTTPGTAAA